MPFCQTEIAHQRFAAAIEQNVSRLEIAMENSLAMRVFDRARNFRHQLHTFAWARRAEPAQPFASCRPSRISC